MTRSKPKGRPPKNIIEPIRTTPELLANIVLNTPPETIKDKK